MPAQLVALSDGPSIWLDKPILLVGRHPECDIQIDSRKISRRHCCIAQISDYLVVRDLGSTNGVRVNGVRVAEGRLAPGDELTIGNHRYRVSWDSAAQPPARRSVKETLRAPQDPAEDELLESCEEPVPLAEPDSPRPAASRPAKTPPHPVPPKEESVILPDKLELAPSGDLYPSPPPSQPPPSRPPA
jgi:predicted component of type VI protein secretion system